MGITIKLPNGDKKDYEAGVSVQEIMTDEIFTSVKYPIVAARINNDIASLSYKIEINCSIEAVTLDSREGTNIYRRSLCFLLNLASKKVFPSRRLIISHSLGKGYLYYAEGMDSFPEEDTTALADAMHRVVEEDLPIKRRAVSYNDAMRYFKDNNQPDTELLLKFRNDSKIPVYECGNFMDLSYGPLVPSTGFLKVFELKNYPPGFILRYYSFNTPQKIEKFVENPVLFSIYKEYKSWGRILNVHCVGALNDLITKDKTKDFIQVAEALHNKKIAEIADKVVRKNDVVKIVLIAGPSSSGKTTFAKKLSIQFKVLGINPVPLSVDNYFLPRIQTPKGRDGKYDFEAIEALDLDLLNEHLTKLLKGEEVIVPDYNFVTGDRNPEGTPFRLARGSILILEGIHCLNDKLTSHVTREQKYKIYISALTQLNLDDHNRISTTDNRLLRRMVRDNKFRGYSALEVFNMWGSVRRGEMKNIFPFQNSADSAFNSALDYELSVLKLYAEPLLKTIKPDMDLYYEAKRLLVFLNNFLPIPATWVPAESILREFIGDSAFKY
jgi:uridine kinase